jgi:hypothetical protein
MFSETLVPMYKITCSHIPASFRETLKYHMPYHVHMSLLIFAIYYIL